MSLIKELSGKIVENKQKDLTDYLIKKMFEVDAKNKTFRAVFTNYSKGYYQDGKRVNTIHESVIKAKITFQKPLNALLEVIDSPKEIAKGSTLLYTGGDKVKVRAAGILGIIPINFSIDDPMFSDTRNHKILATIDGLKRIKEEGTKIELAGISKLNNREVYLLKIDTPKKLDSEITHEIYGVDSETFVVMLNEMYIGDEMVSQYMVQDIQTNISLEEDFFKL